MYRIKVACLALLSVLALLALTATGAEAAEEKTKILPESGVTFTSRGGASKLSILGLGTTWNCTSTTGSGTIESANLGKFTTSVTGCVLGTGQVCTGAGDSSGTILSKGTYHFWLALETLNGVAKTLVGALVELPEETHFTCVIAGLNQLFLVKGCLVALATPLNTLAAVTRDNFAVTAAGDPLITTVLPQEKTESIECVLLTSLNGGAFTMSGWEGALENEKFKKGETAVTVLLMNPEAHE